MNLVWNKCLLHLKLQVMKDKHNYNGWHTCHLSQQVATPGLATVRLHASCFFYFQINLPVYLSTHCKKHDKTRHLNQLSVYQISLWQFHPKLTKWLWSWLLQNTIAKAMFFLVELAAVEKKQHYLQLYLNVGVFRKDYLLGNAREISRGIVLT